MYTTNHHATKSLALAFLLILAACSPHASQTETPAASAVPASGTPPTAPAASSAAASSEERDEADESSEMPATASKAQPSDASHRGPRIKGIQLGDSLNDVQSEVKGLWPDGQCELRTVNETIHPFYCDGVFMAGTEFNSGRLSNLYVTPLLSERLFGNMRVKDFVQNFASAYGVPSMEAQTGPTGRDYLLYRDDSGWEVTIFDDNSFDVKAVATPGEQTKSFN